MTARLSPAIPVLGIALAAGLLLPACSVRAHHDDRDNGSDASITIGNATDGDGSGNGQQSVAINVPGFSAKINVPDLDLGSDTTKIDDLKIFPGTKISSVNIAGQDGDGSGEAGKGDVSMGFTAPGSVADVVSWYKDQAHTHGWSIVPPAGGNQFEATRPDDKGSEHFALQIGPAAGGSSGRFVVTGR